MTIGHRDLGYKDPVQHHEGFQFRSRCCRKSSDGGGGRQEPPRPQHRRADRLAEGPIPTRPTIRRHRRCSPLPIEHFKIKTGAPATPILLSQQQRIRHQPDERPDWPSASSRRPRGHCPLIAAGNLRALAVTVPSRIAETAGRADALRRGRRARRRRGPMVRICSRSSRVTPMPIVHKLEAAARQIAATDRFSRRA